jgi:predicted metalloprotease with PDZ domain
MLTDATAPVRFTVRAPDPHDHLFVVEMEIDGLADVESIEVHMPVWTPGSYLVREYPRHVQNFAARDADDPDVVLSWRKSAKGSWRIDCARARNIVVSYEVFSHELAIRTNHLDDSHGYFNGPSLYMYVDDRLEAPVEVRFEDLPDDWEIFTGLRRLEGPGQTFRASDVAELLDCPVEMGPHEPVTFEVDGVPHRYVFWGVDPADDPTIDVERIVEDTRAIVEANASIFGGELPYDDYTFIVHLSRDGRGGLEHRNSTVLMFPALRFREHGVPGPDAPDPDEHYLDFLRLVAHEHFHVWNVKRIRPRALTDVDYQSENYTRDLWTIEGITSYYELRALLAADIIDAERYLELVARAIRSLDRVPGRRLHSLEDASFDAWIKLYRPDEHTRNSSVSYYLKGELVTLLLDLVVRSESDDQRSFDDVIRHVWEAHGDPETSSGYPEGAYEEILHEIAGTSLTAFFDDYIRGTTDLDWDHHLHKAGLTLERSHSRDAPRASLEARCGAEDGRPVVRSVVPEGAAARAGVYAGDELVALERWRVTASGLDDFIDRYRPGDELEVHLFRRGRLHRRTLTLGATPPDTYEIQRADDAWEQQLRIQRGWLGDVLDAPEDTPDDTSS